jgi:hypothetical protein
MWSEQHRSWFARSQGQLMRYVTPRRRDLGQIPGLFGGLGQQGEIDAPQTSDQALLAAANALPTTPCANHSPDSAVMAFQRAWNNTSDPHMGTPHLTEDGEYGSSTASAANVALGGGAPAACPPGWFSGGGGGGGGGGGTVTPPTPTPAAPPSSTSTWVKPLLIAGGVGGAGLVGYALYRRRMRRRRG